MGDGFTHLSECVSLIVYSFPKAFLFGDMGWGKFHAKAWRREICPEKTGERGWFSSK